MSVANVATLDMLTIGLESLKVIQKLIENAKVTSIYALGNLEVRVDECC